VAITTVTITLCGTGGLMSSDQESPASRGLEAGGSVPPVTLSNASGPSSPPSAAASTAEPTGVDEPGLRRAFLDHRAGMVNVARRALGSGHLAEEAVQETFARAWRSRHRFDAQHGSVEMWLYGIERHLLIDMSRARRRQEARDARLAVEAEPVADHAEATLSSVEVEESIRRLSPGQRELIVEMYFRGRTSKEMAAVLGIPEGTVRSRLFTALKALRANLDRRGWDR
jgi:RNA polymerase sigma-70 factor (ECF subfamily)